MCNCSSCGNGFAERVSELVIIGYAYISDYVSRADPGYTRTDDNEE